MSRAPEKNPPNPPDVTTRQVRLEVLRLAYRHDKDAPTIVERAAEMERYVMQGMTASAPGAD